jgi:radical SAM protein with 4Fe4S-binding SPASM domain
MLEMAKRLGASSLVFNRYIGPAMAGLTASPEELRAALGQVTTLRANGESVKFGNCVPACFAPTGQAGCLAGRAFCTVDPWGRVRPCNHAPLLCGSLLRQSVEEVWASTSMDRWRRWQPAQCRECTALPTCRGGCHAQALSLGLEADPLTGIALPSASDQSRAKLILFERARPVGRYALRPEGFGSLLMAGNRLLPVSHQMQAVLDTLDGRTTLQEIEAEHGPDSLALVASLYQQGMVELQV